MRRKNIKPETKKAALHDYHYSDLKVKQIIAKHSISMTTLYKWLDEEKANSK